MEGFINFYPTPKTLFKEITKKLHMWNLNSILEPQAGKGDMVDYIKEESTNPLVDCIEINPELRATLRGKGYSVIADDFLEFTPKYHYDLIIMNPPFDNGAKHLLKALDIQKRGGQIICILNAETLKNPYTNERKELLQKLTSLNATIEYRESEFTSAERSTTVEIAVVNVTISEVLQTSFIFENLKEKVYKDVLEKEVTDIVDNDYLSTAVLRFNMEVDAGINLIREYKALSPYIMASMKESNYNRPLLTLKVGDKDLSEVSYVRLVRKKYWEALFKDSRFTGPMTSDMQDSYALKINELVNYDFSLSNIKELQIQICGSLVKGIEATIMKLFDELSYQYAFSSEFGNNIHYYNGWSTNKCYYVNSKVILPKRAWNYIWKRMEVDDYSLISDFTDMEKAFNYLAGCPGANIYLGGYLRSASEQGRTKEITCKYFKLTFYKKGTVHIQFTNEILLKKLNIFAGKNKNMLPPSYGKKHYYEMSPKERSVVDEFDGSIEAYENVMYNPNLYLMEITPDILQLAG